MPTQRFNHRINVFIGDFDRAILAYATAQDPAINSSDVFRDALRYYAWHHPGFDHEAFERFLTEYRKTIEAPPPAPKRKRPGDDKPKKKRRRRRPPATQQQKRDGALRLFDDEAEIYRRRTLLPTLPEPALPIEGDFAPLENVADLPAVESDFSRENPTFDEAALHDSPTNVFVGGLSSDALSRNE